ncbi:hypothetical protein QS306_05130 [Paraburkholderia bonniea]|uniref:hypothetical protein n=1 Tax=Paraburkholderia bonniea TaxID=2152891 RepID=UPI001FEBF769|nr:hypothetical protein [Paraburkholderia bonniea]WJF91037.1 hypothetical protein QS306_05130 [Paraburkholderia bonniea]WJF94351.1 hypothetical protein QS308_05135 [Paraburkholderia bonniea]
MKTLRCTAYRQALTPLWARLLGVLALSAAGFASAQQVTNPGDIIVERQITPRIAYRPVPKDQDPVAVRATTFPANTFDPAIATLVSDTDLTNAHGSNGITPGGALGNTGLQAVTRLLSGSASGGNVAQGVGASGGGGLGSTISSSVTGALAPLSGALGGALGGVR